MESINDKQLVQALRCSSSPMPDDNRCKTCPYCVTGTWREEEFLSCDCDRIGMDAAARLEELTAAVRGPGDTSG